MCNYHIYIYHYWFSKYIHLLRAEIIIFTRYIDAGFRQQKALHLYHLIREYKLFRGGTDCLFREIVFTHRNCNTSVTTFVVCLL